MPAGSGGVIVHQAQAVVLDGRLGEFPLGDQMHADMLVLHQRPAQELGGDSDRGTAGGQHDAERREDSVPTSSATPTGRAPPYPCVGADGPPGIGSVIAEAGLGDVVSTP